MKKARVTDLVALALILQLYFIVVYKPNFG